MSWDTTDSNKSGNKNGQHKDSLSKEWEAILYTRSEDEKGHSEEYRVKLPKGYGRILADMRDQYRPDASIKDMIRSGVQHLLPAIDHLTEMKIPDDVQSRLETARIQQELEIGKEKENFYEGVVKNAWETLSEARDYTNKNYFWDTVDKCKRLAQSVPEPYKSQIYSAIEKYS